MIVINGFVSDDTKKHLLAGGTHPTSRRHANLIIGGGNVDLLLPDGYTRIAFIESTGTQWIDTDFIPNQDTRVVTEVEPTITKTSQATVFGTRNQADKEDANAYTFRVFGTYMRNEYFGSSIYIDQSCEAGTHISIDHNKDKITVNGITANHPVITQNAIYPLRLFGMNATSGSALTFTGKMWYCKIYDNDTLVRNYVPCIDSNGKVGMYDFVGKKFYGSSSSNAFVAGEEKAV